MSSVFNRTYREQWHYSTGTVRETPTAWVIGRLVFAGGCAGVQVSAGVFRCAQEFLLVFFRHRMNERELAKYDENRQAMGILTLCEIKIKARAGGRSGGTCDHGCAEGRCGSNLLRVEL